jgi:hypothetical protein
MMCATYGWKALDVRYNFTSNLTSILILGIMGLPREMSFEFCEYVYVCAPKML